MKKTICLLPGDGIGPEIIAQGVKVLEATAQKFKHEFVFDTALIGGAAIGVMLTGMGSDGCEGAKVLREKGGCLIAQNEASCVVYGMPKAVIDAKLANQILDADDIAQAIMTIVKG